MTCYWTLMLTFAHFPDYFLVPMCINRLSVAKAPSDVSLCCPLRTYFTAAMPLALQKIISGGRGDDPFGAEVKPVANASLEQVHETCLETSAASASVEPLKLRTVRVEWGWHPGAAPTFIEDSRVYRRGNPGPLLLNERWRCLHPVLLLVVPWNKKRSGERRPS